VSGSAPFTTSLVRIADGDRGYATRRRLRTLREALEPPRVPQFTSMKSRRPHNSLVTVAAPSAAATVAAAVSTLKRELVYDASGR
jgi:hypothetical protein